MQRNSAAARFGSVSEFEFCLRNQINQRLAFAQAVFYFALGNAGVTRNPLSRLESAQTHHLITDA
jgi:hypothetical protein